MKKRIGGAGAKLGLIALIGTLAFILVFTVILIVIFSASYYLYEEGGITYTPKKQGEFSGGYVNPSLPALDDGERFYYPVNDARLSSLYGNRYHPVYKEWRSHKGVDFDTPNDKEVYVYPSRPGVVYETKVYTGNQLPKYVNDHKGSGTGQMVIIQHDVKGRDVYTVYMHLYRVHVKKGDIVGMGTPIGIAGNTGTSTGAHLHFEIRLSPTGNTVDPLKFLYCGGESFKKGDDVSKCFNFRE